MRIFSYLYDKTIAWSAHSHAPFYLAGVSFAESSFFPIPPDIMLVSMGLARPNKSCLFAFIATCFSVLGGIFGYVIGHYFMAVIEPLVMGSGYAANFHKLVGWFELWGVWIVILAGFSPFPYKLFTVTAGAMHLPFLPFIIGSIVGRGLRFFLVSGLIYYTGDSLKSHFRRYIDIIGWSLVFIFVMVYLLIKFFP